MAASVQLLVTFLVIYGPTLSEAHGRVLRPASRASAYLANFPTPVNYDDHGMYCGGRAVQHDQNGGKCGICGDPYSGPLRYERPDGDMVQHNIITATYSENEIISLYLQVTVSHRGYHEFRLCDVAKSGGVEATQECLDRIKLTDESGVSRFTQGTTTTGDFFFPLVLPKGMTCEHCVLQWKWKCGNDWGCNPPPDYRCGLGFGDRQEEFYACSDIMITPRNGSFNNTLSTSTSTTTTTLPTTTTSTTPSTTTSTASSSSKEQLTTSSQPFRENTTLTTKAPTTSTSSTEAPKPSPETPIKLTDSKGSFLQYFQANPNSTLTNNSSNSMPYKPAAYSYSRSADESLYSLILGPANKQNGTASQVPSNNTSSVPTFKEPTLENIDQNTIDRICAACAVGFKEPSTFKACNVTCSRREL